MIRTLLALLFFGLMMFFAGVYAALHPVVFLGWLSSRSEYISHIVNKDCKLPSGWYPCDNLQPK